MMSERSLRIHLQHKGESNPNQKILKLAQKITERTRYKITSDDPEYWGLACVLTDEMADVALKMNVREYYSFELLCNMNQIKTEKEKDFQELIRKMCEIGILEYDYGNHYTDDGPVLAAGGMRRYRIPSYASGLAWYFCMDGTRLEKNPELAVFFEQMTSLPYEGIAQNIPPGGAGIGKHVIPVEAAIPQDCESLKVEHISFWLQKYEGHLAAGNCACRQAKRVLGEGTAEDVEGWCLYVGDMADYCIETGKAYAVTQTEALEIFQRAEALGFVHQITNVDGEDKIFAICNCNVDSCYMLKNSQMFRTPNMSRSAYVAGVDKKKCFACGSCTEYCPSGAVRLGQKLCDREGLEIRYKQQELPDARRWGPDKWDPDFRDTNKKNCYESGTAPCKSACPAHVSVQGYLKLAGEGRMREALALIKRHNPFPAVCSRICHRPCEDSCTRGFYDQPIAVNEVKKVVAQSELEEPNAYIPPIISPSHEGRYPNKIAIVGAGPAGLTAAFYLAQMGYYPHVFEKEEKPGGMLTYGVPSYKLSREIIEAEIDVMREMGVMIATGVEVGKDITVEELRNQGYQAFFFAIGRGKGLLPKIPGIEAQGVCTASSFMREANTGQKLIKGRIVVVGGGVAALDTARVCSKSGAPNVMQVCMEVEGEMPVSKEDLEEAALDRVIINNGWAPKEILVKNGRVAGITFKQCLSVYRSDGKYAPRFNEQETVTVKCDCVIFAVGQEAEWGNLLEETRIRRTPGGVVKADGLTFQTDEKDIFVGGEVFAGTGHVIDAIAQGHHAAESIHRYVQGTNLRIGRNRWEFRELDKENLSVVIKDKAKRQEPKKQRAQGFQAFDDLVQTMTMEQVRIETSRCLNCGTAVVDPNRCLGCGICTVKCAFDAIHLSRELPEASRMYQTEERDSVIFPYKVKRAVKILTKRGG